MHVLIAAALFVTVFLLVVGLVPDREREERIRRRLERYSELENDPRGSLSQPFASRVVLPLFDHLGHFAAGLAPARIVGTLRERLEQAGNPAALDSYLAAATLLPLLLPALYVGFVALSPQSFRAPQAAIVGLLLLVGLYVPSRWLTNKVEGRQHAIQRALPDALDLMVVSMEAGLSLDGAMARVVEKSRGPLTEEFQKTLREIQLGAPRRDAFRRVGGRTGVKDLANLFKAVVQADQMGVGLGQVMRVHADESRVRRGQDAEERAHQAGVKMLFPLIFLILPSMLIVTAGPAIVAAGQLFTTGLGR